MGFVMESVPFTVSGNIVNSVSRLELLGDETVTGEGMRGQRMYKIMIGDDEGIVIDALTFIINRHFEGKCIIESAKSGRSVIELAENFRPDIVIMDIQMPGINGIEAMKEIKEMNSNTIFIVLSAYDKFDYAREALNIGALDYLNKPIQQDAIV